MGDADFDFLRAYGEGIVELPAVLVGAGAGLAPIFDPKVNAQAYGSHWIQSLDWTATGLLTLGLRHRWMKLVGVRQSYQDTNYATVRTRRAARLITCNPTAVVVGGVPAKTITLAIENTADNGTNTLADLTTTQAIYLTLLMKNSAAKP